MGLAAAKARGTRLGGYHPKAAAKLTPEARARGQAAGAAARKAAATEDYADLLPMLRELRAEGRSLASVALYLNACHETTRTGAAWSKAQVKRVLDRAEG
jgi:Recombinase